MQQPVNKDEFFFDTFQPFFVSLKPVQMQRHNLYIISSLMAAGFGTTTTTTTTTR